MKHVSKGAMLVAGAHAVLVGLATPAVALAQSPPGAAPVPASSPASSAPGGDVIDLKGGGILRGTLIEAIPNVRARIQLVTGEIATVPWPEIARIERAEAAAPPATGAAPSGPASANDVWVHIDGSDAAELQRDTKGDHRTWETVCQSPCDQSVSSQYTYRISGNGIRNSSLFTLQGRSGQRETLTVDEASKGGFVLGIVGTSVGSFVTLIGLLVVLVNAAADTIGTVDGTETQQTENGNSNGEDVGWAIAGVGLFSVVGGIVLIATNAHTGVSQAPRTTETGLVFPMLARAPLAPMPAFRDARRDGVLTASPMIGVPLLGGRF